jgi:lipoprotein NlpD
MKKSNPIILTARFLILLVILITIPLGGCVKDYVKTESREGFYYVVKKGDTLYRIANDHKMGIHELAELNNIEDMQIIKEGLVLFIPGIEPDRANDRTKEDFPKEIREEDQKSNKLNVDSQGQKIKKHNDIDKTGRRSGKPLVAHNTEILKDQDVRLEKEVSKETVKDNTTIKKGVTTGQEIIVVKNNTESPGKLVGDSGSGRKQEGYQKGKFIWPLKGKVISTYGPQANGMFYNGIRIETKKEDAVQASSGGHVIFSALLKDYGETVIIKHDNNYATVYTHLQKRLVRVDQRVKQGGRIALIIPSSTGLAFFDFEIRYKNKAKDPLLFLS